MVYGQIVEGSAKEIAEQISRIAGDRRISVLLMQDLPAKLGDASIDIEDVEKELAEIRAMAVHVGHVDDSREAIYTRMEGE